MTESYDDLLKVGDAYCRYVVAQLQKEGVNVSFVLGYENQLMEGDTTIGVEIKYDRLLHVTGNVYIEIEERRSTDRPWVASGIYRQDRSRWYGIGDYHTWYVYAKAALRKEHARRGTPRIEIMRGTSRGFVLRPGMLPRVRERVWDCSWNGQ